MEKTNKKEISVWACPYCEVVKYPNDLCMHCGTTLVKTSAVVELPEVSSSDREKAKEYIKQSGRQTIQEWT